MIRRLTDDGRLATLASGVALVAGAARATGQHPAPGSTPAWLGIGLGLAGLATVGYAISRGDR
jgi:NAD/NADP transhydrogenase alpha subunit